MDRRIAILGWSGRFPGAPDVDRFWRNIREGRISIRRISPEEALANGARPEDVRSSSWVGAEPVLDGIDLFDPSYFGLSPRDATWMAPEQRILLELCVHALEHARIPVRGFSGRVGVFLGGGPSVAGYAVGLGRADEIQGRSATIEHIGTDKDYLASRVAYALDLRGPAMVVQSACSTGLLAVHVAAAALLRGECDVALAGAAAVRVPHGVGYVATDSAVISPDGTCRPLDAEASGTVFGSGAGVVVLSRPDGAGSTEARPRVWLLGSAAGNDGRQKASYAASSARGISEVIAAALRNAEVDARSLGYLELHGTATALGDPAEIQGATRAFREWTDDVSFCTLGAVKGNIGHADAAAGMAGLLAAAEALVARELPPIAGLATPNPRVPLERSPFRLPGPVASPWHATGPRRAGVTALGIGGTNVHVVLEEAEPDPRPPPPLTTFNRQRYWLTAPDKARPLLRPPTVHLLSGGDLARVVLDPQALPWLLDHQIAGRALLPGALTLELVWALADQLGEQAVDELILEAPIDIDGPAEVQVRTDAPDPGGRRAFRVDVAVAGRPVVLAARGQLWARAPAPEVLGAWPPPAASPVETAALYRRGQTRGLSYGPAFRAITAAWAAGPSTWFAELEVPQEARGPMPWRVHPVLVDAALHVVGLRDEGPVRVPHVWSGAALYGRATDRLRVRVVDHGKSVSLTWWDEHGAPVATVHAVTLRPFSAEAPGRLYHIEWRPTSPVGGARAAQVVRWADREPDPLSQGVRLVQEWLATDHPGPLVWVTRGAVATRPGDAVPGASSAPLWGLVRTLRAEHPDRRLVVVDVDGTAASEAALATWLETVPDVPEIALRDGQALVPHLAPVSPVADTFLDDIGANTDLSLRPGAVRVRMWAAGLNFRDVLAAEGRYPDGDVAIGLEGAGVVEAVEGDTGFSIGDRVFGLLDGALGAYGIADHRVIAKIPDGWSFERAASVPMVFLTAWYALVDLANLQSGERILIHSAAGGVGSAAVQIARALDAEVYATASPAKHAAVRAMGVLPTRIASDRTLEFESVFLAATGGRGFDVVLDALAGPFVDASLRLLPRGGRFVEMGKADVRDPEVVRRTYPGVVYRAFDLAEAGPDRLGALLRKTLSWMADGRLRVVPVSRFDRARAREAFRFVAQARHVGKVVIGRQFDPTGTALVTGATGGLGPHIARHLVVRYGARRLLLVSRSGPQATGVDALVAELEALGAEHVEVSACDLGDRAQVERLVDRPLTAIVHAAGILADGTLAGLELPVLRNVLRAKADSAWLLHELTAGQPDLAWFVLFSSVAGSLPSAAQAAYAAANVSLDTLAAHRRAHGLPATSLAWGPWAEQGMAARLDPRHRDRLNRRGLYPLPIARALELFDAAMERPETVLLLMVYEPPMVAASDRRSEPPVRGSRLAARLASVPSEMWSREVLELVRAEAAAVLGAPSVSTERTYSSSGLDSMMLVELRHRLVDVVGERLPVNFAYEHPTPAATADFLMSLLRRTPSAAPAAEPPPPSGPPGAGEVDGAVRPPPPLPPVSPRPASTFATLAAALLTVLMPVLILGGSAWMLEKIRSREEREEFANAGRVVNGRVVGNTIGSVARQMDRTMKRFDPRIVVVGNSLSHTDIVPAMMENRLGLPPESVQVFSVPRSVGTHWYAILENRIVKPGYKPDVLLVLSDLQSLLITQPASEASYINLVIQLGPDEPLIDEKISRGGYWFDRLRENRSRFKNATMETIRNISANLYQRRISLAGSNRTESALEKVFSDENVDVTLAGGVMPTFTKEKELFAFDPYSLPEPEESFVGPLAKLASDNGIRPVFVRPPMSPFMPEYAGDIVPPGFEERVLAIVAENGGTYLDLRDVPMSHGQFRNIDHMNPGGARRFSVVVADRIRDTAPGAERRTDLLQSPRFAPRDLALPTPSMTAKRGKHGFIVPELSAIADDQTITRRNLVARCSPVRVKEDGALLPEHNVTCTDLTRRPVGQACHVGDTVLFTASDGTWPTDNGRTYTLSLDPERRCDEALWLYPHDVATFARPAGGAHLNLAALAFGPVDDKGGFTIDPGGPLTQAALEQGLRLDLPPGLDVITLTNHSDGYLLVTDLSVVP